ncbi:MAG: hypothetical protein V4520_10865 [Bacteroidota bacterium]
MKSRILLLFIAFSTILVSCKKDNNVDPLPDAKKQIIGTWKLQSATAVAYDASGKEVDRETESAGEDVKFQFVNESSGIILTSNNEPFTYTITSINGKITLAVLTESYQVSFNNSTMTWTLEEQYDDKAYAKKILTYQFTKLL